MAAGDRTDNLVVQVRDIVLEPVAQGFTDAEIIAFLDEGQVELCAQLDDAVLHGLQAKQTAALTLDEEPYALPSDFMRARLLVYKSIPARPWTISRIDELYATGDAYNQPSETAPYWYLWENALYIRAGTKSAGNYDLHYYAYPATLSGSVDPDLGQEFDSLLVAFAIMRLREKMAMPEQSELRWAEYMERCAIINSRLSGRPRYEGQTADRSDR